MEHTFVALPDDYDDVFLYDAGGKAFRQVLWGDWIWIDDTLPDTDPKWRHVLWAPNDPAKRKQLKIKREHTTGSRPLEIIFVDVGQGDGAVLITPERDDRERIIVVDAGEGPEMGEFLDQRFGAYRRGFKFHAAVITHPDEDHYFGFKAIFDSGKIKFDNVYHSGLVERRTGEGFDKVGGLKRDEALRMSFLEDLVETDARMRQLFSGPTNSRKYASVIKSALDNQAVGNFAMLSTAHGTMEDGKSWMPGFAPSEGRPYQIEVLGPYVETGPGGKKRLRKIEDYGKTKNGHSVILRLCFKDFRVLFGGDLNLPAEKHLLMKYAGIDRWPANSTDREAMMAQVRSRFRAEVLKVCHHGSADVTDEFLEAVDPAAFVISSGDQEGHVHPRPDLLGRLGRKGRGQAPVLLSTELQRSTRAREDEILVAQLTRDIEDQIAVQTEARKQRIADAIKTLSRSNVDVDGAIYLKTDGDRLITAFKKESRSDTKKWFYFEYRIADGKLLLVPR
jgi:beta-lactamase superfamily II metal-dependent hydrolase